jgi:PAS domain S-box-containing protein
LLKQKIKDRDIPQDVIELIHELQVHQIEIEIQNEELIKSQLRLQKSQKRYLDLFNFAPVGYFSLNEKELIKDVNIAGANLLGLEKNNLINKAFITFVTPNSRKILYKLFKNVNENKEHHQCELELLRQDKPFPVLMEIRKVSDTKSKFRSFFLTVVDIIELKKAEEALKKSEEKYRLLLENLQEGIWLIDKDSNTSYVNQSMADMLGYTVGEMQGKHLFEFMDERGVEIAKEKLADRRRGLKQQHDFEFKGKDGKRIYATLSATPIKDNLGNYQGALAGVIDISLRKKAEKEIKSSLEEKEVLLSEIHHRVNNNMQIISSLLNLQKQYVEDDKARKVLIETQNRVKSMAMIHEKLYQSIDLAHIEMADYIESLVKELFYSYAIEIGRINPILEIDDITLNLETAVPCGLLISELISNSLKHTFPEPNEGEIRVSLKKIHNRYKLTVSDNGVRLPDGDDFLKADSLGLQLINNLASQIESEIELEMGQRTEFKIVFKELDYKKRL